MCLPGGSPCIPLIPPFFTPSYLLRTPAAAQQSLLRLTDFVTRPKARGSLQKTFLKKVQMVCKTGFEAFCVDQDYRKSSRENVSSPAPCVDHKSRPLTKIEAKTYSLHWPRRLWHFSLLAFRPSQMPLVTCCKVISPADKADCWKWFEQGTHTHNEPAQVRLIDQITRSTGFNSCDM